MTFAEFEQLPDLEAGKRELIDGEVIEMPPPKNTHSVVATSIMAQLLPLFGRRVRGDQSGYRVGGGWLVPDVSVTWPDQKTDETDYLVGSPMVAIEVLSSGEDISRKIILYLEGGAAEVWVFDYRKKTMWLFTKRGRDVIWTNVSGECRSEALGITISLANIFGEQK